MHSGRTQVFLVQLRQIDKVERRDACRHSIHRHACQFAAHRSERHKVESLNDFVGKPRICARIQREGIQVVLIMFHDFARTVANIAFNRFPFAQNFLSHRVERVLLEWNERAANEIHAVEHEASGNHGLTATEITPRRSGEDPISAATDREFNFFPLCDAQQNIDVEIDDVPACKHIRVEAAHALDKRFYRRAFVRESDGGFGQLACRRIDDQNFVNAVRIYGDGQQFRRSRICFDVEGQNSRNEVRFRWTEVRILEDDIHLSCTFVRSTFNNTSAANISLNEIRDRKAQV